MNQTNRKLDRSLTGILLTLGLLCLLSAVVLSAEYDFAGTWKGELAAAAAPPAPGGGPGGAPGGRGGPGGGGFGGGGGVQKITLRVKVKKEKATGNFTLGSAAAEDIKEGRIEGNKLTFKTGQPPAATYINDAVMIGEELSVTRTAEGGRGGRPTVFTLKRNK